MQNSGHTPVLMPISLEPEEVPVHPPCTHRLPVFSHPSPAPTLTDHPVLSTLQPLAPILHLLPVSSLGPSPPPASTACVLSSRVLSAAPQRPPLPTLSLA